MTEIRITFFKGPASNVKPYTTARLEWDDFAERLSHPKQGPKDGSYYVRGVCQGDRSNDNMVSAWLAVVDADHGADNGPCPPFDVAVDGLERINLEYCIYTSFSYLPEKPRYRILFPLEKPIKTAKPVAVLYRALLSMLAGEGIHLRSTQESATFSQPWYPPRYQTDTQLKNFRFAQGGLKTLGPAMVPKKKQTSTASRKQIKKPTVDVRACIEAIRSGADVHNSINAVVSHLAAHGVSKDVIATLAEQIVFHNAPADKVTARLSEIPRSVAGAIKKFGPKKKSRGTYVEWKTWKYRREF